MYQTIIERINDAASRAGRVAPKLIAVSKTQPNERVADVLTAGHRVFGENRVQEAIAKWPNFRAQYGDIELHLLGPLQTNKVNQALPHFQYFHALDRMKLASKFAQARDADVSLPQCFVQINIGNEPQKAGVLPDEFGAFMGEVKPLDLPIIGLMCIPPAGADSRPFFQTLRYMAHDHGLPGLSMGMSGDFEIAIEEGATMVRVGSAIFGARDYQT